MTPPPPLYLLLAGCALFGAIIIGELAAGTPGEPTAAGPVPSATPPSLRPEPRVRADQLLAIALARPLFDPQRRPPETAGATAASPELSDARLTGIVIERDRSYAIFDMTGAKPLTVGEGETVSGWRIDSIAPTAVSLTGPGGTRTLQPKPDPNLASRAGVPPAIAGQVQAPATPVALLPRRPGAAGIPPAPPPLRTRPGR
jgi:hypothetical protein